MSLTLLTESVEISWPQGTGAQILWTIILAVIVGVYIIVSRTRRRAKEDYIASKRHEAELRANDPDMRKDEV